MQISVMASYMGKVPSNFVVQGAYVIQDACLVMSHANVALPSTHLQPLYNLSTSHYHPPLHQISISLLDHACIPGSC